jgi:hypothetical protein
MQSRLFGAPTMRQAFLTLALLVMICVSVAGIRSNAALAAENRGALFIYPGATEIWRGKRGASDQLSYHVDVKYPAPGVIDWVSNNLEKAGWRMLDYDFLNPNISPRLVRSWGMFVKGVDRPRICERVWHGYWRNASGDLAVYYFRYSTPCGSSSFTDLEVLAGQYPKQLAEQIRLEGQRLRANKTH